MVLVFSQKTGTGLLYHSLFHPADEKESPLNDGAGIKYSCTCIDDFLLPFAATEKPFSIIPLAAYPVHSEMNFGGFTFYTPIYTPLRGPPALING